MQCPGCGFENIPGSERCCICSAALASRSEPERLSPPRARDRSLAERLRWAVSTDPTVRRMRDQLPGARALTPLPQWMDLRAMVMILLSVMPGLGHILVLGNRRVSFTLFLGSLLALGLACIFYRSPVSNLLAWSVVLASMYSVFATVDRLRNDDTQDTARTLSLAGTGLVILCCYLSLYVVLRVVVEWVAPLVTVRGTPVGQVMRGDTLLLERNVVLRRGDVVAAAVPGGSGVGPIVGLPGERIYVSDRVYVNGRPASRPFTDPGSANGESLEPGEVTLGPDEYWIMPQVQMLGHGLQYLAEMCVVTRSGIQGRAAFVVNPPAHRRRLGRVQLLGE